MYQGADEGKILTEANEVNGGRISTQRRKSATSAEGLRIHFRQLGAALLISSGGGNRLPGLTAMPSAQVVAHHINNHGREHQKNSNPEAQTAMRAFPIRTTVLMISAVIRAVVRVVAMLDFVHCRRSRLGGFGVRVLVFISIILGWMV
jgi:hypothetical protein